jgi:hypothetical protein
MVQQKISQNHKLRVLHALEPRYKLSIEKDALFFRDGVYANQRMHCRDWVLSHEATCCESMGYHILGGMYGLDRVQLFAESRRETPVPNEISG